MRLNYPCSIQTPIGVDSSMMCYTYRDSVPSSCLAATLQHLFV
jgi:hypothetical protein